MLTEQCPVARLGRMAGSGWRIRIVEHVLNCADFSGRSSYL